MRIAGALLLFVALASAVTSVVLPAVGLSHETMVILRALGVVIAALIGVIGAVLLGAGSVTAEVRRNR